MQTRTIIPEAVIASALTLALSSPSSRAGEWSISMPIHAPNLTLDLSATPADGQIEKSVGELFDMATAYATFGVKYQNDDGHYISYQGWYGKYGNDEAFHQEIPSHPNNPKEVGMGFNMKQQIHAIEMGIQLLDSHDFELYGTVGVRDYDLTIDVNVWQEGLGLPGSDLPGLKSVRTEFAWHEITAGIAAKYTIHGGHTLDASYSLGNGGSYRAEAAYGYRFDNGIFTRTGYRVDYFEADGIPVEESGVMFEFGYTF